MEIPLRALLASRFTTRSTRGLLGRAWRGAMLAALALTMLSGAQAQVLVGGNRPPDVTIDQSVLDQLGPPPTLPQLFGARGASEPQAETLRARPHPRSKAKAPAKSHKVVRHKTQSSKLARRPAPSRMAKASSRSKIHLVPPSEQAAAPAPVETKQAAPAPSLAATVPPPPAPLPPLPQPAAVPAAPVIPPSPPHVEAPKPPAQPPAAAQPETAPTSLIAAQPATPPSAPAPTAEMPAAAKPAAPAAAGAPPAPVQMASAASMGSAMSAVKFAAGATDVPPASHAVLDAVAAKLLANDNLRVQLIAHATGGADEAMEARRVSLARAVAVRAYLIEKGVRSLRMDVRALGNRSDEGPATDEVDLLVVSQ